MLNLDHKKMHVWQKSMNLVEEIYLITNSFPREERFGLISQLRRAAVSIPSNISEGAARSSAKERKRFYEIARSSLVEVDTQLEIALTLNLISQLSLNSTKSLMNEVFAMLSKMKNGS